MARPRAATNTRPVESMNSVGVDRAGAVASLHRVERGEHGEQVRAREGELPVTHFLRAGIERALLLDFEHHGVGRGEPVDARSRAIPDRLLDAAPDLVLRALR